MRVATWLPRALRDELAGLDPAPAIAPARPRPDIDEVIARAANLDDNTTDEPGHLRGATDPVVSRPGARPPAGRFRLLAIACSALLVAGLAIGLTRATRSHPTQPGASGAIHRPNRSGTSGAAALYGVTWLDTAAHATVVFAPGTAHWSDGCAGETQALAVTSHHLHLGASQPRSRYMCSGPPLHLRGSPGYAEFQREQRAVSRFFAVLDSTPAWSITGQQLTLTSPSGRAVTLTSQGTAPLTLPGSRWKLRLVIPIDRRIPQRASRGPTLAFDHHGRFRATDGVEMLTGTATIDNDHVTLARDPSTYRGPRKPAESTAIDTMLSGQLHYQIENNTLRLTKPNTDGMLIYAPAAG